MNRKELVLKMLEELEPELFDSPIHVTPASGAPDDYDVVITHAERKGF